MAIIARCAEDHPRGGEVNDGVDAFQIHAQHFVPLVLGEFFDGRVFRVPDARVRHQNIQPSQLLHRVINQFLGTRHAAQIRLHGFNPRAVLARFRLHMLGRFGCAGN